MLTMDKDMMRNMDGSRNSELTSFRGDCIEDACVQKDNIEESIGSITHENLLNACNDEFRLILNENKGNIAGLRMFLAFLEKLRVQFKILRDGTSSLSGNITRQSGNKRIERRKRFVKPRRWKARSIMPRPSTTGNK